MKDRALQSPYGVIFFTPKVTLIPDQKREKYKMSSIIILTKNVFIKVSKK